MISVHNEKEPQVEVKEIGESEQEVQQRGLGMRLYLLCYRSPFLSL